MPDTKNTPVDETTRVADEVSQLRLNARKLMRMEKVNRVMTKILVQENLLDNMGKNTATFEKNITRANYALGQLDEQDPDFAEKTKNLEADVKYYTEEKERSERIDEQETKTIQATLKTLTEGIDKWETGESKINMEDLEEKTKQLINQA